MNLMVLMYFMSKKWNLKSKYPQDFVEKFPAYDGVILQLLYDRGLDTQEKIDEFLNPDYSQDLHDPFLFNDMQKAVDRIFLAVKNNEKILIHGDYDADGVTSATLLEKTLQRIGLESVDVFIPHREIDGYGLNLKTVEEIIEKKYNLLITVDCGITNHKEVLELKNKGIDTIITDHHLLEGDPPQAVAVLDPSLKPEKYPYKKLAGVGVVFKLAQALFREKSKKEKSQKRFEFEAFEKWLLDLVAIGTIADVSPILGENRTLVKYGLMVLNKTQRKGLRELIHACSLSNGTDPSMKIPTGEILFDLSVRNIAWQIAPRINAAGRVGHANVAYKLLTTRDEVEALALTRDITEKNNQRQQIADQMIKQAEQVFEKLTGDEKIYIAENQDWMSGLVGLGAGRLKDKYSRPVILFAKDIEEDIYVGSGRSISEFNITLALEECGNLIKKSGGHSQACGLTIEGEKNFKEFIQKISSIARDKLKDVELVPSMEIDMQVKLKDLNWELWDELQKFEPFAEANPLPLFLIKNVKVEDVKLIGKNNKHLKFIISQGDIKHKAISFFTAEKWYDKIKIGDMIDVVVEFGINEWNGNRELQFKVVDWKRHANNDTNICEEHANKNLIKN